MNKVYVLLVSEEAGPIDSATTRLVLAVCWYEDKIVGCYSSRKAAERAGENLGDISWRIEEHDVLSL